LGGFSRKGAKLLRTKQIKEIGLSPILSRIAKICKNHFLPHSITSMYKEIKCILKNEGLCHKGNHYPHRFSPSALLPNLIIAWWELIGGGIAGLPLPPPLLSIPFRNR